MLKEDELPVEESLRVQTTNLKQVYTQITHGMNLIK